MEYKRIFKDGIHLFAGKAGTIVIALANLMILSRVLTTEEMGKYSLFLMIVNLALIVGLNWSDSSIVRHGREEYVKHKKINQSFWARIYIFIPVIIFFTLLFIIFSKQITNYIGISRPLIILIIVMFIFNGLLNFITYIYQSMNEMKKSAYVLLSQKIFYLICLIIIFLGLLKGNLTLVIILINLTFLLSVIINILTFDFKKLLPYKFNKKYFKKIWAYSWPQLIGFPGLYVVNYIDIFVIRRFWTLADVGMYNIAYSAFLSISGFIMLIHVVLFPLIVEYRTKNKFYLIKNYLKKIPVFSALWIVLVIIGLFLSKHIIPLVFSEKYALAVPSFNILLIASIFYFVSICLLPIINAFDLILYSQIFNLIKSVVNIGMDFILVPKLGIIGGAYGTLISYFVGFILSAGLIYLNRTRIFGVEHD